MNENFANAADEPVDDDGALHLQAGVPLDLAGLRFDQALAELFPDYSRSRLAGWIKAGDATIDGRAARPRDLVRGGETVRIATRIEAATDAQPEPIALDLLYEDADLLIVNKPAGLVVHPGAGNHTGTLVNALLHRDPALAQLPRAGIVHRLDKDTSGALVVARTLPAHTALVAMLSARDIHRQYDAIALGELVAGGTIDQPIDRHPADRLKMAVVEDGRPAVTHYRLRERFRAHTRLQVQLETGRTHQIRVHLTHLRHPLIGDPVYGGGLKLPKGCTPALADALRGFRRQALHAEKLAFDHPLRGVEVVAEAPLPADMADLIAALRADAQAA